MRSIFKFFNFLQISFLFLPSTLNSQVSRSKVFNHISIDNGLSNNTVYSITQDKYGRMWFATENGLNCYDGSEFSTFFLNQKNSESIASSDILSVFVDSKDNVFALTSQGLSLFSNETRSFENFFVNQSITDIEELSDSKYIVSSYSGLYILDLDSERIEEITDFGMKIPVSNMLRQGSLVYLAVDHIGIKTYSISERSISNTYLFETKSRIRYMIFSSTSELYLATEGDGLFKIDKNGNVLTHFSTSTSVLPSDYVRSLCYDSTGLLWIGTTEGLIIYDESSAAMNKYVSDPFDNGSLSHSSVLTIYLDSQGGMWLGTYFGGVNYWHAQMSRFNNIYRTADGKSLSDNVIGCVEEDLDGSIWVGTNRGGLNHIDADGRRINIYYFPRNPVTGIVSNDVKTICIEKESIIIGTHGGGLGIINRKTDRIETIKGPSQEVYAILPRDKDTYWVGTLDGLEIFDRKAKTITQYPDDTFKYHTLTAMLYSKTYKQLWLGGSTGLFVAAIDDGKLNLLDIPQINRIRSVDSMFEASDGMIWISTSSGLYRWDGVAIKQYSVEDGFPTNALHGIEEDKFGCLWIGSDKGLVSFNPRSGVIRNYFSGNGLQTNGFTPRSHCYSSSGRMIFGCLSGLVSFIPDEMGKYKMDIPPIITKVEYGDGAFFPDKSLTLSHRNNTFTISYSVTDYSSNGNNEFKYILEGIDKQWTEPVSTRTVTYRNVRSGNYCFKVMASNSDGEWNENFAQLKIRVKPAWYGTLLSKILFFLFFMGMVTTLVRILKKKNREDQDRLLMNVKMGFLSTVSHQLRTNLMSILSPMPELLEKSDDIWMTKQLKKIDRNANRLLQLSRQLTNSGIADIGGYRLRAKKQSLYAVVHDEFMFFDDLAKSRKIEMTLEDNTAGIQFFIDETCVGNITNQMLSTAFKYWDKGRMALSLNAVEEGFEIVLSAGCNGFQEDDLSFAANMTSIHHGNFAVDRTSSNEVRLTCRIPQNPEKYSVSELMLISDIVEEETENLQEETKDIQPEFNSDKEAVIILENNRDLTDNISRRISNTYNIIALNDPEKAMKRAEEEKISAIIVEENLTMMSGIKFCKMIKQNFNTCGIPVIVITGESDNKSHLDAFQSGADDVVVKPFSTTVLLAKLRNMINSRKFLSSSVSSAITPSLALTTEEEMFIEKLNSVIIENIADQNLTTGTIASIMEMSRSGLYSKVKSITGKSLIEIIHTVRFSEACKLLKEGKHPISEICFMTGFNSISYFSTSFKKFFGCVPSEYVRKGGK